MMCIKIVIDMLIYVHGGIKFIYKFNTLFFSFSLPPSMHFCIVVLHVFYAFCLLFWFIAEDASHHAPFYELTTLYIW